MKKIFIIVILIIAIYIVKINVYAISDLKIESKTYINTNIENRVESKYETNKGNAFCITAKKTGSNKGTSLKYVDKINNGSILYLLDQAKEDDHSYLITQLALWMVKDNYMADIYTKNSNSELVKEVKKLASIAKENKDYTTSPTLTIKNNSDDFKVSDDKTFYKSAPIKVIMKNNIEDASITLSDQPDNTLIVNSDDNEIKTVKNNDVFYIKIPYENVSKNSLLKVTVKVKGYDASINKYSTNKSKWQDLIILSKNNVTVKKDIYLNVTVDKKCRYLNNSYYGKDGKKVDEKTYSIECEKHTCEKVGSKYFNKNGLVVSKIEYQKECEIHICEEFDEDFFGKDGNMVDYYTYKKDCMHICEIYDNHYYGKDGKYTSEETYKKECDQIVEVPNTSSHYTNLLISIIGSLLLSTCITLITYKKN